MNSTTEVRTRYAESAKHYDRYRPSYPATLIDWLVDTTCRPPARVADVGCGTGIATRLLAERGFATVGIDPSQEMLAYARAAGGAQYVCAHAAATALAPRSIDLVCAAQCFHWFEPRAALAEFERVLRPGGWCAAFWNLRAATPVMEAYYGLVARYSAQYDVLESQERAPAALRSMDGLRSRRETELQNVQQLDRDGIVERAYSSSCVKNGVSDKAGFEQALLELFDRHQRDGHIELGYRTVAIAWQLA